MKAEELSPKDLRIGNILTLYGETVTVQEIGNHHGSAYLTVEEKFGHGYHLDQFQPIPLTEEVLLKSNFIEYANVFAYELRDLDLSVDVNFTKSGGYIVSISDEKSDFSRVLSTTMKLHELQNLITSFGEELEVKWS